MPARRVGYHYYGDDGHIYRVSAEAIAEMRENWVPVPDYGVGHAPVKHLDWWEVYKAVRRTCMGWPPGFVRRTYNIYVVGPDDKQRFLGSATPRGNDPDSLLLEG